MFHEIRRGGGGGGGGVVHADVTYQSAGRYEKLLFIMNYKGKVYLSYNLY